MEKKIVTMTANRWYHGTDFNHQQNQAVVISTTSIVPEASQYARSHFNFKIILR